MTIGSCFCRAIIYEISGKIAAPHYCHCSRCRKLTGSAFGSTTFCLETEFKWLDGETLIREFSGTQGSVRFCQECGSRVPTPFPHGVVYIPAGSLDDADLEFQTHIFVGSKASWDRITDDLPQYDGSPSEDHLVRLVFDVLHPE